VACSRGASRRTGLMTGSGTEPLRVSIILRACNESRCLPDTVLAVQAQECCAKVELVLVDSGSTDGTQDVARSLGIDNILSLRPADFSFGRALNRAAQHSVGNILVIISAHARPAHEHWLAHLLRHFDNPEVGGVYGRQIPRSDAWPPVVVDYRRCYGDAMLVHQEGGETFFSNANSALRRSLWAQVPFDEELPACEDQDWARRVVNLGYQVVYEPLAAVSHSHNEGLRQLYRRRAREERGWRQSSPLVALAAVVTILPVRLVPRAVVSLLVGR
jgi:rhamnosyltransferase